MKNLIEKYLGEAKSSSTKMECMECGHKFKKKLSKNTVEVKCPKCKGNILIYTEDRPLKIECPSCGAKGTLK